MNLVYRALADPTRREILRLLRERDRSAGEIARHVSVSKPTLSGHFAVLKEADLVRAEKAGTTITYSLNLSVLEDSLRLLLEAFRLGDPAPASPHAPEETR